MSQPSPPVWKSLLPLFIFTLIDTAGLTAFALHRVPATAGMLLLSRLIFSLLIVRWVQLDRASRRLTLPYEYDAFLFFAWIILLPAYLYRTRGPRGILPAIGFFLLAFAPRITADFASLFSRL